MPAFVDQCDAAGVFANTLVCNPMLPRFGLEADLSFQYRVYVLRCKDGVQYVGIEHRSKLRQRIHAHFDGNGAFFTKEHKPLSVWLSWPAAGPAVEAYVFYSLLEGLPAGTVHRLGGWTQTSVHVAPLPKLLFEQDRRLLKGACFNCGGSRHSARDCSSALAGAVYKCNHCRKEITITPRGQSLQRQPPQPPAVPTPVLPAAAPKACEPKRPRPVLPAEPAGKRPKVPSKRAALRAVKVCGNLYAPLSWYLGVKNPPPCSVKRARKHCGRSALELSGGHCRALQHLAGTTTDDLEPVSGERQRLGTVWVDSAVPGVQLRRVPEGGVSRRLSQVLFLVQDLDKEFGRGDRQ